MLNTDEAAMTTVVPVISPVLCAGAAQNSSADGVVARIEQVASGPEYVPWQAVGGHLQQSSLDFEAAALQPLPSARQVLSDCLLQMASCRLPAALVDHSSGLPIPLQAVARQAQVATMAGTEPNGADWMARAVGGLVNAAGNFLRIPGADASSLAYRGSDVFQSTTTLSTAPAPHKSMLAQINDDVQALLVREHALDKGGASRISVARLVVAAIRFAEQDKQSRLALVRQIQQSKGHYGGHADEVLAPAHQESLLRHWVAHNMFGTSIERFLEKRSLERDADGAAPPPPLTSLAIRNHLDGRLVRQLDAADADAFARNWIWSNVVQHVVPIIRYTDTHHEALGPQDMEWGKLNAGLLFAQNSGLDISKVSAAEALALGQLLLAQVTEGDGAAQGGLHFFRLPSMLLYAQVHPEMMRHRGSELDVALEMGAMREYVAQHERNLREQSPVSGFNDAIARYKTRRELAQEIIDDKCSGMDVDTYLNLSGTLCRETPHDRPYENPVYLDDIDKIYQQQIDTIAAKYAEMDRLLILAAWNSLDEQELEFLDAAMVRRASAEFSAADQLNYGTAGANPHARASFGVGLAPGVELFGARQGDEERIYALRNRGEGLYEAIRVGRDGSSYFPLMKNTRPQNDADFKLKVFSRGDVVKEFRQELNQMLGSIVQQHQSDFSKQLYDYGYVKTKLQKTVDLGLSLIPLYTCVTAGKAGQVEEAFLACSLDVVMLLPVVGSLANLSAKFGQALAKGSLLVFRNALAEAAVGQSLREMAKTTAKGFAQHALGPAAASISKKELVVLAMQSLRVMDPGLELTGMMTKKTAMKFVQLGRQMDGYLPALRDALPKLKSSAKALPSEGRSLAYARLAGIDEPIPVTMLAGQKYNGRDVYVKCALETGEPFGAKYVIADGASLSPIPIDESRRLKNVIEQGLGGKGGPRQSKVWAQRSRAAAVRADAQAVDATGEDALAARLAGEMRQLDIGVAGPSRVNPASGASGVVNARSDALTFDPEVVKLYREGRLNALFFGAKVKSYGPLEAVLYDLEKNLFLKPLSSPGTLYDAFFYQKNKSWLKKISPEQLQRRVVTDEQRMAVLKALGIEIDLVGLSAGVVKDIPKKISCIWIGPRPIPEQQLITLKQNVDLVKASRDPYAYRIFLSQESRRVNEQALRQKVAGLEIVDLETSDFYADFKASENIQQFMDATGASGPVTNYASAVDILRLALLKQEGGLYLEVDNVLKEFGEQRLVTRSDGDLLLSAPIVNEVNGPARFEFSGSIIGAQPDNPTLELALEQMYLRYQLHPDFYKFRPDPHDHAAMKDYASTLYYLTGSQLLTDVISEKLPGLERLRANWQKLSGFPVRKSAYFDRIYPLFGMCQYGELNSWLHY